MEVKGCVSGSRILSPEIDVFFDLVFGGDGFRRRRTKVKG